MTHLEGVLRDPARLAALQRAALLDTSAEEAYDRLARLTCDVLKVPVALVSLVDGDRQFLKSCVGLREPWASRRETPLTHSICQFVVATGEPLVIEDAREAPELLDNLAIPELGVVAYAGVPLKLHGETLGTLCAIDHVPRKWNDVELRLLQHLAGCVMNRIELGATLADLRRTAADREVEAAELSAILDSALDAVIRMDSAGMIIGWNVRAAEAFGWSAGEAIGRSLADTIIPHQHRAAHQRGMTHFLATGEGPILGRRIEITGLHRTGREFPVELTVVPVRTGDDWRFTAFVRDITARRQAEADVRTSRDRFDLVSRATNDVVWDWDLVTNELWWNDAFCTSFGYATDEIEPGIESWVGRLHPDDRERVDAGIHARIDAGESTWNDEYRFRRADGSYADIHDRGYVIRDLHGRPVRMVGAMMDVTLRRRAELGQRATYRIAQAATAVSGLPELLALVHDIVGELLPARNFYVALLEDDATRLVFPYFVDELDPPPAPRPLGPGLTEHVLRTGQPLRVTPEVHRDLEQRGLVELVGAPALDWIGVPLRVQDRAIGVLVVQNYSAGIQYGNREQELLEFVSSQVAMAIERTRAEGRVRDSAERYRLLFEANPEAMWVYDSETRRFLAVNDAAIRRYGFTRDEFLAMTIMDIRPPAEHWRPEAILRDRVEGPAHFTELHHRRKDGALLDVEIASDTLMFAGRLSRLVLARDVTERKSLEGQFRQAQKMEAVGQLAGGVAHDFNNLLTAISGYGEMLMDDLAPQDPRRQDVDAILAAANRAAALTHQLLAFSRKQVLQPRILNLNEVVANSERLLRRLIGEDVSLTTVLQPDLGAIAADPAQLEQVIVNLAVNARDAMPRGGRLTIETRDADLDAGEASEHPPMAPGRYVRLIVSDTGHGMDEATKMRLFEPFFTTKGPGKGTGLGLSTVYGIVKQSGGFIWVHSEFGAGTVFTIYLPRVAGAAATSTDARSQGEVPRGTETVLLVEDEPALRAVARRTLERQGYAVLEAADADAALALAAARGTAVKLILTDVVMPGSSGPDLVAKLTATLLPRARVLYMSGYTEEAVVRHGIEEHRVAFLQKPFSPETLARKVRDVLDET